MARQTDQLAHDKQLSERLSAQQRLIDALCDPACYPHPVDHVQRIDTHISTLLLAGDYAYKIKKAVVFAFVDYGTLAQRRRCCEAEIRLNRRFAPRIYLGYVAIRGSVEHLSLTGHGPILEYAVKMRRFAAQAQGDVRARQGLLTEDAMDKLAARIAEYHCAAPRQIPNTLYGHADTIIRTIIANLGELDTLLSGFAPPDYATLSTELRHRLLALEPALDKRRKDGFVRECHGDLHLANIIYENERWVAFDCVEFDAGLRWLDVMEDIAFTVMDLHAHALPELANRLLNRYLEITGDYAGLAVLRLYLVHRALVRAKVLALGGGHSDAQQKSQDCQQRYLAAAATLSVDTPRLIITHGVSGSGKSWAARWIAQHYGYIHIRSDVERKRLHNLSAATHSHAEPG